MQLIAIEGLDNAHKRDVAEALVLALQAYDQKVVPLAFPSEGSPLGELLSDWRMHPTRDPYTFEMLQAADKQEAQAIVQVCRDFKTDVVLLSRYVHALYAYGSLACDIDWLVNLTREMVKPDIVLYLDVSAETALRRGGYDVDDPETRPERERLDAVRHGYELSFRDERLGRPHVVRVDANYPAQQVIAAAIAAVSVPIHVTGVTNVTNVTP